MCLGTTLRCLGVKSGGVKVEIRNDINDFLQEEELQEICNSQGTWGLGTVLARAGGKASLGLMSIKSETDQILLSANREVAMPIIAETPGKISRAVKDPALFDIPTATFAVLMPDVHHLDLDRGL